MGPVLTLTSRPKCLYTAGVDQLGRTSICLLHTYPSRYADLTACTVYGFLSCVVVCPVNRREVEHNASAVLRRCLIVSIAATTLSQFAILVTSLYPSLATQHPCITCRRGPNDPSMTFSYVVTHSDCADTCARRGSRRDMLVDSECEVR